MTKRFEITIGGVDVRAVAELLEEDAPKTCAALWGAMKKPFVMKGHHAMWSGCEIVLEVPSENRDFKPEAIPNEHVFVCPAPGSIGWIYFPPRVLPEGPAGIWNIPLMYGPAYLNSYMGSVPANIWARITEGLEELAEECAKVQFEGVKTFRFRRLKG